MQVKIMTHNSLIPLSYQTHFINEFLNPAINRYLRKIKKSATLTKQRF